MILEEFKEALMDKGDRLSVSGPLEALALDARGDWDAAHLMVQAIKGPEAEWVHAYLHRVEGDLSNADYWYRRAQRSRPSCSTAEEWDALATELVRWDGMNLDLLQLQASLQASG